MDNLVSSTMERFGSIDILINNAGVRYGGGLMLDQPFEKW